MKKSLLLLAATVIVASCSKTDSINEVKEIPIDFTKAYVEKGTKAIHRGLYTTDNFESTGNTMGVYGWKKVTKNSTTTDTQIFSNVRVDYNETVSGDWGYSPKRYWDGNADKYRFYAYAPHSSDFPNGGTVALTGANDSTTFSITGFSQATTVKDQVDLLVDLTSQFNNTTNKATTKEDVSFTFRHILSQVNFYMGVSQKLKNDAQDNPVQVQSVSLNGVYINGTYAYSSNAWQWGSKTTTHDFSATPSTAAFFTSDHLTATADTVPGLVKMLLIPNSVSGYSVTVNYTIGSESFEKTINLSEFKNGNTTVATWASGFNYNYTLVIGPEPIEFDMTKISSWGDGGSYTYTIQ